MKFRLEFDVKKLTPPITHVHRLFLIGSCFTENIGSKLRRAKFTVLENPNGILFNPVSVSEALIDCIENRLFTEHDFFLYNEAWHSWRHHSRFSALTAEEACGKVNTSVAAAHTYLKHADYVMITLGSAWVYMLSEMAPHPASQQVAANNHKAPADWFYKKLLTPEEVLQTLDQLIHRLFHFNPELRIIFTISPVRHAREGLVENNRSKAVLIHSVHQLVEKFERLYYFPAYELVIDDLRDYRFYSEDLVHPNYFATEYVWEKFAGACLSEESRKLMEEIHAIQLAYQHKPFHSGSAQHQNFLRTTFERTRQLQEKHGYLDLEKELKYFRDGMHPD